MNTERKMIIVRTYTPYQTRGHVYVVEGEKKVFECYCIELPFIGNKPDISCILEGVYLVIKTKSPTQNKQLDGIVFLLQNVPGRAMIEMHIGNYASGKHVDTKGCILPGLSFVDANGDGFLDVIDSTKAMTKLLELMPDKFKLYIL